MCQGMRNAVMRERCSGSYILLANTVGWEELFTLIRIPSGDASINDVTTPVSNFNDDPFQRNKNKHDDSDSDHDVDNNNSNIYNINNNNDSNNRGNNSDTSSVTDSATMTALYRAQSDVLYASVSGLLISSSPSIIARARGLRWQDATGSPARQTQPQEEEMKPKHVRACSSRVCFSMPTRGVCCRHRDSTRKEQGSLLTSKEANSRNGRCLWETFHTGSVTYIAEI